MLEYDNKEITIKYENVKNNELNHLNTISGFEKKFEY